MIHVHVEVVKNSNNAMEGNNPKERNRFANNMEF